MVMEEARVESQVAAKEEDRMVVDQGAALLDKVGVVQVEEGMKVDLEVAKVGCNLVATVVRIEEGKAADQMALKVEDRGAEVTLVETGEDTVEDNGEQWEGKVEAAALEAVQVECTWMVKEDRTGDRQEEWGEEAEAATLEAVGIGEEQVQMEHSRVAKGGVAVDSGEE